MANLGLDLLIGLEFISLMRLVIDTENRQFYFKGMKSERRRTGICNSDNLIHAPMTQNVVTAKKPAIGTVLTIPNKLDNGALVANSVSEVVRGEVNMILINPTNYTIEIKANTQLDTFYLLTAETCINDLNRIIQLKGSDETVSVGEDLDKVQIRQLQILLDSNKTALSH